MELCCSSHAAPVDLSVLPEEAAHELLQGVLLRGKLTPRLVSAFLATGHELVIEHIKALNLRDLPPVIPDTRNPWLGDEWRRW